MARREGEREEREEPGEQRGKEGGGEKRGSSVLLWVMASVIRGPAPGQHLSLMGAPQADRIQCQYQECCRGQIKRKSPSK